MQSAFPKSTFSQESVLRRSHSIYWVLVEAFSKHRKGLPSMPNATPQLGHGRVLVYPSII